MNDSAFTNRLAQEKSPYLLQHAHNPVDWFPWGEEAFAKARREQKPIFLSIGYSTCHWCHVMERESFETERIGRFLNEHFVSIKVDREERPDVDRVYMTFVQATTGSGGWPMSVWLTPELKPFVGGTYFPPADAFGRPGFLTILGKIAEAWRTDRERLVEQGEQMIAALRQYASGAAGGEAVDAEVMDAAYAQLADSFDPEHGGFGTAPKFPRPVNLNFLLRVYAREPESARGKHALEMVAVTLRRVAAGGMHDHLGGGFSRYSVDRFWHIPHFEKMLYDQAQLAISYLEAFQITRDPLFEQTARGILDYVRRDMTHAAGGFFSAEDADSAVPGGDGEKGEGAFYVWTKGEIEKALGAEAARIFGRVYGVESEGNAPDGSDPHGEFTGQNTLIRRCTDAEAAQLFQKTPDEISRVLGESRAQLFALRAQRPRPHLDDKIITAWNGLMISAFARAAQVLGDSGYLAAATRAAGFIETKLMTNGHVLLRSYREGAGKVEGFADDYAFYIQGSLDLYEAGFDTRWLELASHLQEQQNALFADAQGGFFTTTERDPSVLLRMKEDHDGAEPSPNSVSALNLLRLAEMTGREEWRAAAAKTIGAFAGQLRNAPAGMPQMLVAFDSSRDHSPQIIIAGKPGAADTEALLRELHAHFRPRKTVLLADGGPGQQWFGERLGFVSGMQPLGGRATAYVCENRVCKMPTSDLAEFREALR